MTEEKTLNIKTFKELEVEFEKMFLFADKGILRLLLATIVGNQLDNDPIWMMIIASSSGGKSELINALDMIQIGEHNLIFPISDLTTNTFASGMKRTGKETSLLHRIPIGGILTFKDFTSMLSKGREERTAIMGQMREIYDQKYIKETGTGEQIKWEGKIGVIAASTEVIYQFIEELSAMGDRFVMYSMEQPDALEVTRFVMKYKKDGRSKEADRKHLQRVTKSYTEYILDNMEEEQAELSDETAEDIMIVADFCTKARSGIIMNERKGHIDFIPSREMPVRMMEQLLSVAKSFIVMRKTEPVGQLSPTEKTAHTTNNLTSAEREIIYKIAFDSIPIKRRIALRELARYDGGVKTRGLATSIGYPTEPVNDWLQQLTGLDICYRESRTSGGEVWHMRPQYRQIMMKFEKLEAMDGVLEVVADDDIDDEEIESGWSDSEFDN